MWAALCALFLGALDALIMAAAMPTIVADLSGLHFFSWVYSAYFLARAVALPLFGKIADVYGSRNIFLASIFVFLVASAVAGCATSMIMLVVARAFQGVGSGGIFALVYIVLSNISEPAQRGKMLSFASSVWGLASVIGPTLGGIIVTYMSWRWIFFLNVPIALLSIIGIAVFLIKDAPRNRQRKIDLAGAITLSAFILCFLLVFILEGKKGQFLLSGTNILLLFISAIFLAAFIRIEKTAVDPVLDLSFFSKPGFALGNLAVFSASFAIFSLFAYAPLFIQGALGKSPIEVGGAMLFLSLGWSCGSLLLGRIIHWSGERQAAMAGGLMLALSGGAMLFFSLQTPMVVCFSVFLVTGLGMGFITLSTLLLVQHSVPAKDLGVATSFHQFSRTLGGTVGVGICGGLVTSGLISGLKELSPGIDPVIVNSLQESVENIFREDFLEHISHATSLVVRTAVADSMTPVHIIVFLASLFAMVFAVLLGRELFTASDS